MATWPPRSPGRGQGRYPHQPKPSTASSRRGPSGPRGAGGKGRTGGRTLGDRETPVLRNMTPAEARSFGGSTYNETRAVGDTPTSVPRTVSTRQGVSASMNLGRRRMAASNTKAGQALGRMNREQRSAFRMYIANERNRKRGYTS